MSLGVGARLGHYAVTAKLGQGGMGEVWRATDTQLGRDVALKILPEAFASDPDRLARFQREAQVLASLNHPNIAQIHGIEEQDDTRALVLELVEGPTLAERITKGPIPLDEALPIAKQIAEALEAAHEAGVIHRDLKPANIKVREDGTVKVLDFGLAKALDTTPTGDPSESPTLTAAATPMGVIMGTAAYMSPEQAKGKAADRRSDVWAFGAVLYEMLTGRRAFGGDDVSDTLVSVFRDDPDWSSLSDDVPPSVRGAIQVCLQKDPKQRVRDISAVRLAMDGAFETTVEAPSGAVAVPALRTWQRPVPAVLTLLLVAAATAFVVGGQTRGLFGPEEAVRFVITPSQIAPLFPITQARNVAISTDGGAIIYAAGEGPSDTPQLVIRALDQLEEVPLRGTDGGVGPFFSPDGQWVGFGDRGYTTLRKVPIFGGPPATIYESPAVIRGATWSTNGRIIVGTAAGLFRIADDGNEEPEVLTTVDTEGGENGHFWPSLISGANAVVFVVSSGLTLTTGQLAILRLDTGAVTRLGLGGVSPSYVSTGHLVYADADGSILAVPFDPVRLEVTDNPLLVLENVQVMNGGGAAFAVSEEGRLVYVAGAPQGSRRGVLVWVDRDGVEESINADARAYAYPRISPDGARILVTTRDQAGGIWIWDTVRENLTALQLEGRPLYGHWTPDGRRVVFRTSGGQTGANLFSIAADGTGSLDPLAQIGSTFQVNAVTPDGRGVVFSAAGSDLSPDLFVLWLDGDGSPEVLLGTEFREQNAALSPRGDWLAYVSDASGRSEIYARPFPDVDARQELVSISGGNGPLWSKDGRELFYREGNRLMSVPVPLDLSASFGTPRMLFEGEYGTAPGRNYDVSTDGRFLMIKNAGLPSEITVVLNWFEELKRLVPTN